MHSVTGVEDLGSLRMSLRYKKKNIRLLIQILHDPIHIYGQASGISSHPPPWYVWSEGRGGGAQERAGGCEGCSAPPPPNLDPKALQNPEPRPETNML